MNLTATDAEINDQLKALAESAGMTIDELYSRLDKQGITKEDLGMMYKNKIIIEKLLENTVFVNKDVEAPELVRASHILVDSEEKAKSLLAELDKGASFEELAKNYSKDSTAANGGDLGYFSRGKMVAEFEKAAFETPVGKVSGIVKTQYGFHILKVTDKVNGGKMLLKDITNPIQRQSVISDETELIQTYTNVFVEKANVEIMGNATATTKPALSTTTTLDMQKIKLDAFAACLSNKGAELYGAEGCSYCEQQKQVFGDSFSKINYAECAKKGDTKQTDACDAKGIEAYPTWIVKGKLYKGFRSLDELGKMTGCLV
jgi:hypothetical protein